MRKTVIVLLLFIFVNVSFAQKDNLQTGFNGIWILNTSETKILGFAIEPKDSITEISLENSILKIVLKEKKDGEYVQTNERIYYTDGRGETNGNKSTITKWKGNKLVSKVSKQKKPKAENLPKLGKGEKVIGTSRIDSEVTVTWELSGDGKKLTELHTSKTRTTTSGPLFGGENSRTSKSEILRIVYDKQ